MRIALLLAPFLLAACDDTIFPNTTEEPVITESGFCGVVSVLNSQCLSCHSASAHLGDLDLETSPETTLFEQGNYGMALVVPNDPAASLLLLKIRDEQPAGTGSEMPPSSGGLSVDLTDLVEAWILDGASTSCDTVIEPPGPIEPGAPIDVGPPPGNGAFAETPPDFAPEGECYTGQWWQYEGDSHDGLTMHPGVACIACHTASGEGPIFSYAGTVMGGVDDGEECRGIPGVKVEILDTADEVIATQITNAAGNFAVTRFARQFEAYRVRLSLDGREREMVTHQDSTGDCNSCHTAEGLNGAPGRVVAP